MLVIEAARHLGDGNRLTTRTALPLVADTKSTKPNSLQDCERLARPVS